MKHLLSTLLCCIFALGLNAQQNSILETISYRPLGPYRAGSWVLAIAVPETGNPDFAYTFYVAGRNGGVWKTENNGTTFSQVFDSTGVSSIGALAVSNSNPDVVWSVVSFARLNLN